MAEALPRALDPEIRLGQVPVGVVPPLVHRIGQHSAFDLIATGRVVDADEAQRLGIVQRLVEPEKLMEEASAIAAELAGHGADEVATAKRLIRDLAAAGRAADEEAAVAIARAADTNQQRDTTS